jgi:hypothetical protein
MALFDVPTLIKQLQALDSNEDPFAFLADKILAGTDQGWTTGHTIVVSICSALWWGSLLANGTAIVRRWRAGELCFVRRQASRLGNFYIPHVTSLWSAIQIPVGLAFQLSIGIMLFEAYGRPLRYSFGLRNIVYMVSIPLAWFVTRQAASRTNPLVQDSSRQYCAFPDLARHDSHLGSCPAVL